MNNQAIMPYEILEINATKLKNYSEEIRLVLENIKSQYELIYDTWSGYSAKQSRDIINLIIVTFPEFSEAVENYANFLMNNVIPQYKASEGRIKTAFEQVAFRE